MFTRGTIGFDTLPYVQMSLSLSFHQWWSFAVAAPQVHLFLKKAFERLSEALRVSVFAQAIGVPGNGPTVYWSFLLLTVIDPEFWAIAILHQKLHQIAQVIAAPAPLVLFKFLQGRQDVAAGVQGHLGKREVKLSWGIMGYINVFHIAVFFDRDHLQLKLLNFYEFLIFTIQDEVFL